ncbi:MAG: MFS transporter [Candidatus Hydrogenedentes bacterium]|nr:MFS transporter [Candidatus Hydrogenedentota bacterium]
MQSSRSMNFGRYDYAAFLTFFTYAAGSVVIPVVLVQLARDLGFSLETGGMSAGGALHLGRTIPMVASMLVCGFAAGRWGVKRSLGWSVLLMACGMGLCALSPMYGMLFAALMVAGIGEGVIEGLATPLVQEQHPEEPGRYINFSHGFWSVGVLTTVLVSGVLLSLGVSWRVHTGCVALLGLFPALLLLLPESRAAENKESIEPLHWRTTWNHAYAICRTPRFWLFFAAMFVAGGGEFCLTFWCASYIQLNFTTAAWAGGVGTAFFAGGMVIGRTGWGYLIQQRHLKQLVLYSAIAGAGITLFMPAVTNLWLFFGMVFLAGLASAPFWPSLQSHCADRLHESDTTMLFILLSCAGVPGCGFFTWLMGVVGNHSGLGTAFYLVPACYVVLALLTAFDGSRAAVYLNLANETANE